MATLNISLPDNLREFIDLRENTGGFQIASDYLRDLIRHDKDDVEHLLMEGVASGQSTPLNINSIKKSAADLLKKKKDL